MLLKSILITGANRGIGLELVKQLVKHHAPEFIFATCRKPEDAVELSLIASKHANVIILELDVTKVDTFSKIHDQVASHVGPNGLNVLFNNAGIVHRVDSIEGLSAEHFIEAYSTNVVGPTMLAQALLPLLRKAANLAAAQEMGVCRAAILNIASKVGSLNDNTSGKRYLYRISKAALNMFTKNASIELKESGILVVSLHPGWVRTDMGGPNGLWSVEESVEKFLLLLPTLNEAHSGGFFWCDGRAIPW